MAKKKDDTTPDKKTEPANEGPAEGAEASAEAGAHGDAGSNPPVPPQAPPKEYVPSEAEIAELEKRIAAWKAERAAAAEQMPAPTGPLRIFEVHLPHTCGDGTIRPRFRVELDMSAKPGEPETVRPLHKELPQKGVRIRTHAPADAFQAGVAARERAVKAFNDFYRISRTKNEYAVALVKDETATNDQPAAA